MKLSPAELIDKGYILLDELGHKELVPFIQLYIKKRNKYSVFYYLANFIIIGSAGYFFFKGFQLATYSFGDRFAHFSYGIAIAFLLLPLHEYIHVLAYKSQGALQTSYDANLKKFYFMALANHFVANKKEFSIVALAPFVTITSVFIILLFAVSQTWLLTIIGVLFAHTAMCSGDFGLLSYFEFHKDKQIVTYDDVTKRVSYFYVLKQTKN
jgi:Putative zincin peptidase